MLSQWHQHLPPPPWGAQQGHLGPGPCTIHTAPPTSSMGSPTRIPCTSLLGCILLLNADGRGHSRALQTLTHRLMHTHVHHLSGVCFRDTQEGPITWSHNTQAPVSLQPRSGPWVPLEDRVSTMHASTGVLIWQRTVPSQSRYALLPTAPMRKPQATA